MAPNMMETLKQIQRDLADQKAYMRNLHLINENLNEKLNFMEEKISFTEGKISDLPQVLITIRRLEQQVKKNNMLLFGNDEAEKNFGDRALAPYKTDHDDKNTDHPVELPEKRMEEGENNYEKTKNDDSFQRADQYKDEARGLIINEIKEVKEMIRDFMKIRHTSGKETATCCIHDAARISPTYLNNDQINKLDDKLNNITNVYQSDMREIKELIKESIAINKRSIEEPLKPMLKQETVKVPSISFSAEQTSWLNADLKRIADTTQSEMREIKELIKNTVARSELLIQETAEYHKKDTVLRETNQSAIRELKELIKDLRKNIPFEGTASTGREKKTVQISPTYFSSDQLIKLNSELKQIADTYQETNIYPAIEVVPGSGDEHPFLKQLQRGVYYPDLKGTFDSIYKVKLGCNGVKRSDVIDMITENPDLTLFEVVRECLVATKVWDKMYKLYQFSKPHIYDENGLPKPCY